MTIMLQQHVDGCSQRIILYIDTLRYSSMPKRYSEGVEPKHTVC